MGANSSTGRCVRVGMVSLGVIVPAMAACADGRVVGAGWCGTANLNQPLLNLDVDGDGKPDLVASATLSTSGKLVTLTAQVLPSSLVELAGPMSPGSKVDGSLTYGHGGILAQIPRDTTLPWQPNGVDFVADYPFRVMSAGGAHYGWATLGVTADFSPSFVPSAAASIGSWGYESAADVPITIGDVPEPAAATALCAVGLIASLGRRRRRPRTAAAS